MKRLISRICMLTLAGVLQISVGDASERAGIVVKEFVPISYTSSHYADQSHAAISSLLSQSGELEVLNRDDVGEIIQERTLGASQAMSSANDVQGQGIRGAQFLLGGSVLVDGFKIHFFGKLINVDDGSMSAFTASANHGVDVQALAKAVDRKTRQLIASIQLQATSVVPSPLSRTEHLAEALAGKNKPALSVKIEEQHITRAAIDPSAETEFLVFAGEAGFPLIDVDPQFREFVDVQVTGEGFTEVSYRNGAAFGVTGRLEVKAVSLRTGRVLAVDRETSVVVASSELIGSKNALAKAAAAIAERMLPKLAPDAL